MKREIKFRCWDDFQKKMFDISSLKLPHREDLSPNVYLMQYTGIKDKNGKEIYEGDIVRKLDKTGYKAGRPFAVKFESNAKCSGYMIGNPKSYVIIGNIYENPELLNSSK